jgi:hypothetical protein
MKKLVVAAIFISILHSPIYSDVLLVPQQFPKIQWAIDVAYTNDTILVSPGLYYENINFLGKTIVVKASGSAETTIIDGSQPIDPNNASVVKFVTAESNITAVLDGFTIRGGSGSWSWPGKVGGGIWIENAQAIIKNCIIKNNYAVKGGGIYIGYDLAHQHLANGIFSNCLIVNNTSLYPFAGIERGGWEGITINHCTFAFNTSNYNVNTNTMFVNNKLSSSLISNTIFWEGQVDLYSGMMINYCDIQGGWSSGVGNIDSDPMFCNAQLGNYQLASNSPCVGAGENGTNIGALGTCGQEYSRFDFPLEIGTTWTYKYDYDYSHFGDWSKRHGIHIWTVIDSSMIIDDSIRFTIASKNIDTVSSSYNPIPTLKIDTTYFYIDRGQNIIIVRPPSNVYPIVDNITGYFSGNDTLRIGGRLYVEKIGLISMLDSNATNTYYRQSQKLLEFNGNPVSVEAEPSPIPIGFSLSQNYPNPFNPSTKISWQTPVSGWQTLQVYDVLGNEIAILVNEYRPAGSYEIEFKSTVGSRQLANGVYFYRVQAGEYVETKKMILLK